MSSPITSPAAAPTLLAAAPTLLAASSAAATGLVGVGGKATGNKLGWTAPENFVYFKEIRAMKFPVDAPDGDEGWKTLTANKQPHPPRATGALKQHVKEVMSDVRTMSSCHSAAEPDSRCPSFDDYFKEIEKETQIEADVSAGVQVAEDAAAADG